METKKTAKADLENKKGWFFQIGLIVALALALLAFEWKTYDVKQADLNQRQAEVVEEDLVEITQQKAPPPPPPAAAPPPTTTIINIVKDDVKVLEDFKIDAEVTQLDEIPAYTAPVAAPVVPEEKFKEEEIFTIVEKQPSFPGGDEARITWLSKNIKYPEMAKESGIQGTVYLTFVVEKDGSVTDVKVLRGIGGGCDEEAVRAVKAMPKWNPGEQRGKPVRTQFQMPIKFTLAS